MIVSILVHAQIYGILFIMQFCAQYCNKIQKKLDLVKGAGGGSYSGVEMHGETIEPTLLKTEPVDERPRRQGAFAQLGVMKTRQVEEKQQEPAGETGTLLAEDQIVEATNDQLIDI